MKTGDRLVALASSVLLILVGGTGLLDWFALFGQPDRPVAQAVKSWFQQPSSTSDGLLVFAGYFLLIVVGAWLARVVLRGTGGEEVVLIETGEGEVELSIGVLENVIASLTEEMDGIRSVEPEVVRSGGSTNVRVNLDVMGESDVPSRVGQFKKRLREELSDHFPIKDLESISVRIKNMSDYQSDTKASQESTPDDARDRET
jgi:uncharacterized alkaline shock family protein YloU